MEMTGITPALWAAVQAMTIQQVALNALIGLAVAAALYVLVRRVAPEAPHFLREAYAYATTPHRARHSANHSEIKTAEEEGFCLRRKETTSARFERLFEAAREEGMESAKASLIEEIVGWLEGTSKGDEADVSKIRVELEGYLKGLTDGKWENLRQYYTREDNVIQVKANGNCGYYAAAGRLLLLGANLTGKLDDPSDNFIDLAAQLRAKAHELACGELDSMAEALLAGVVESWVEGCLRNHFTQQLSDELAGEYCPPSPWESLKQDLGFTDEEAKQVHHIVMSQRQRTDVLQQGLSTAIVQQCINVKGEDHFKSLYREMISRHAPEGGGGTGFWASPFELYLLAKHFELPLRVTRPNEDPVLLNTESGGDLWLEVKYNGIDHFDMVIS